MSRAIREVDEVNLDWRARDTEPAPPIEITETGFVDPEAWDKAEPAKAPAGIVRIPGEELFDAIESEEDIVAANRELLEGRPLTTAESERWARLFREVMTEANKRLEKKGVILLAACPEPNGLGGVLTGCDRASVDAASRGVLMPSEDYTVTVSLPARERVDIARSSREDFVRGLVDSICGEVIEQQKAYRAKAGRA